MEKIRSPLSQGVKIPFLRIAYVLAVELHIFIYTTIPVAEVNCCVKFVIFALPGLRMSLNPLLLFALTVVIPFKRKKIESILMSTNASMTVVPFTLIPLKNFLLTTLRNINMTSINLSFVISIENSLQISLK
jgi:hypothetical protein